MTEPLGSGFIVTVKDIYDGVVRLEARIADITTHLAVIQNQLLEFDKTQNDHERRITKLEGRLWPLPSIAALLAIASLAIDVVVFLHK